MSNLRLINETTADTSVSSIIINNIFSADFDIYKIVSTAFLTNSTSHDISARFVNSSGSIITASNYDEASLMMRSGDSFLERPTDGTDKTEIEFFLQQNNAESGGGVAYVFNPFNASSYTFMINQNQGFLVGTYAYGNKQISVLKQTASITGINIYNDTNSDNFGGGTIKTYGLRVDS